MRYSMLNMFCAFTEYFELSAIWPIPSIENPEIVELESVYAKGKGNLKDSHLLTDIVTTLKVEYEAEVEEEYYAENDEESDEEEEAKVKAKIMEEMMEEKIETLMNTGIGSVNFKCEIKSYEGTKLTVTIFNKGTVKVCCGVPSVIETDEELTEFSKSVYAALCEWLRTTLQEAPKIVCINGIERYNSMTDEQLFCLIEPNKDKFYKVIQPELEKRGRRGAWKLYMQPPPRKLQVSIDKKGTAQVFGARSIREIKESLGKLRMCGLNPIE